MKRLLLALALPIASSLCGCLDGPLILYSDEQMNRLGAEAYVEETAKHKVITGTPEARMVQRVGERIAKACGADFAWEFKLLDAPKIVNAFALPGGKIAVYSGLLRVTQTEDGLATVMGHEVAHATERHGAQRMSNATIAKVVGGAAGLVLEGWDKGDESTKELVRTGLGVAAAGTIQKFSRTHESEADAIGLEFMMRAGYDPEAAPKLWERMAKLSAGREPGLLDAFFASHPPSMERAAELRRLIPIVRKKLADEKRGAVPKK